MSRLAALGIAGLAACSAAVAGPDPVTTGQPLTLEDLRQGARFRLSTTFDWRVAPSQLLPVPPSIRDRLSIAPPIGVDLAVELDRLWPGRRVAIAPHFPLTRAFEGAGDAWPALCIARRRAYASDAREILAYLDAWCDMRTSLRAVDELVALTTARARGLAAAVHDDLADILADSRPAAQAIAWLDEHRVATPEALDALATSYAASDQPVESRRVFDYVGDHDPAASRATTCRRLQHALAVTPRAEQGPLEQRLLALAPADPTCARIVAPVRCRQALVSRAPATCNGLDVDASLAADLDRCGPYLKLHADAQPAVMLFALRGYWAVDGACPWERFAERASRSLTVPGAESFALVALDNAIVASDCSAASRGSIATLARTIAGDRAHRSEHDAQIAELVGMTELACHEHRR